MSNIPVQVTNEHSFLPCPHCKELIMLITTRHLLPAPDGADTTLVKDES